MSRILLIFLTLGRLINLAEERLNIRPRALQLAVGLLIHRKDIVSMLRIDLVITKNDKGSDSLAALFSVTDVAQLVDEGAKELCGILAVNFGIRGARSGSVSDCFDESYEEQDGFEEDVNSATLQGDWLFGGVV